MNSEQLYLNSPVIIQNLLVNLQGYKLNSTRYNSGFAKIYNEYLLSNPQTVDINSLHSFLQSASAVPYWNKKFSQYKINFDLGSNIFEEVKKLPILTKKEVKENIGNIANNRVDDKISYHKTSGTTGSGMVFPQTLSMEHHQWAVWWRYRNLHGINFNTWMGWFGGKSIASINQSKPPYWRISRPTRQVLFSAHHLSLSTVESYYQEIVKRNISWLHGYPSQLSLFANLIKKAGIRNLPGVKHITVGAENLLKVQKSSIEEVFGVKVVQNYGLAEGVANISETPDGNLIPDLDFAFVEFIPFDPANPKKCRIVGTNYRNRAFPLIRYDTGDIANIDWKENGDYRIISIDGRNEDYITLPNGVKLGRLDHIFKNIIEIDEAQIEQLSSTKIQINIVKGSNYEERSHGIRIIDEAKKRFGKDVEISIKYVESISRNASGKFRFVISRIV